MFNDDLNYFLYNKSTSCGTNASLSDAIILLEKDRLKRGITPKIYLSELCPLSFKCTSSWWVTITSLFSVDTFHTFWVCAKLKFLHDDNKDNNNLVITTAWHFLRNRQAKNEQRCFLEQETQYWLLPGTDSRVFI